jgi:5-methylcytosine-specific restriction endonuclease McrA
VADGQDRPERPEDDPGVPHPMRTPCRCGCVEGLLFERGTQDVVRCARCKRHCYNAPRVETGKAVRTVQTVHAAIKPKQRARIIELATGRCQLCGKGPDSGATMHVAHLVSVKQGLANGLTETELNSDENLVCACDECNLGLGKETISLRLALSIQMARMRRAT